MSTGPIVVGTDGSARAERAVDKAGELAQALGAPVHVVCVPGAVGGLEWPQRITAQQIVAKSGDRLRGKGITVEAHLPKDEGDAALALAAVARHVNAQVLVVGNKGMTGIRHLLGSFPDRVSHQAQCHVLIIPTDAPSLPEFGGRPIIVGTDGQSAGDLAVREATRLAKALQSELRIASIAKPGESQDSALESAAGAAADEGVTATTHALPGDSVDGLLDLAGTNDAAIIIIGGKGMHADDRERRGNVPDRLSHKGASSVLIVFTGEADGGDVSAASGVAAGDEEAAG